MRIRYWIATTLLSGIILSCASTSLQYSAHFTRPGKMTNVVDLSSEPSGANGCTASISIGTNQSFSPHSMIQYQLSLTLTSCSSNTKSDYSVDSLKIVSLDMARPREIALKTMDMGWFWTATDWNGRLDTSTASGRSWQGGILLPWNCDAIRVTCYIRSAAVGAENGMEVEWELLREYN